MDWQFTLGHSLHSRSFPVESRPMYFLAFAPTTLRIPSPNPLHVVALLVVCISHVAFLSSLHSYIIMLSPDYDMNTHLNFMLLLDSCTNALQFRIRHQCSRTVFLQLVPLAPRSRVVPFPKPLRHHAGHGNNESAVAPAAFLTSTTTTCLA